ncbi:ferredoxin [Cognatishimia sp. F0-27]|uniref:ferredoxin n=1 Tax=Cognatishimia sp. F0-27 TaxID=2816855 RepID=UPI001D0CBFB2|nr:ferredoxin [Cognatishimia sp. F0-27]MCC1494150.1 ferredoxin [Cognatishimia sp. F0-27]
MTALSALDDAARAVGLAIRGAFHPVAEDDAGAAQTVLMLGPDEPAFWPLFQASDEYCDGTANPLDRWSKRVVGGLAQSWGGEAVFPYDGPPYAPFIRWATRTGQTFPSPVGLLVHDRAGLFISFRGAVLLPQRLALPAGPQSPCLTCAETPCATACPVGALGPDQPYDVPSCRAHVSSAAGAECREGGCLVRRACPVSQRLGRQSAQSAFHMAAFVGQ